MRAPESSAPDLTTRFPRPVVIGHRGASAYLPEHTLESFALAIELGADLIEPDVVVSRDGALVVRHESELSLTTDVADRPEFADRRTTRGVGGVAVTDWFVEDFDLDELRSLRVVERSPEIRPLNSTYDGRLGVITLPELLELARDRSTADRTIGVLVELAPRLTGPGRALPDLIAEELRRQGLDRADSPVVLQSFEPSALRRLRSLLGPDGPAMVQLIGYGEEWDHHLSRNGLRRIAGYAQGVGPSHHRLLDRDQDTALPGAADLVARVHAAGLALYTWTLCPENAFLPPALWSGDRSPADHGDVQRQADLLLDLGVDGLITDAPEMAARAILRHTASLAA